MNPSNSNSSRPFIIAPSSRETSPNHSLHLKNAKRHFEQYYHYNQHVPYQRGVGVFPFKLRSSRGRGKGLWDGATFVGDAKEDKRREAYEVEMRGVPRGIPKDMEEFEEWELIKRRNVRAHLAQVAQAGDRSLQNGEECESESVEDSTTIEIGEDSRVKSNGTLGVARVDNQVDVTRPSTSTSASAARRPKSPITAPTSTKKVRLTNSFSSSKNHSGSSQLENKSQSQSHRSPKGKPPSGSSKGNHLNKSESTPNATTTKQKRTGSTRVDQSNSMPALQGSLVRNEAKEVDGIEEELVNEDDGRQGKILFEAGCSQMIFNRTLATDADESLALEMANQTAFFPPPSFPEGFKTSTPPHAVKATLVSPDDGNDGDSTDTTDTTEESIQVAASLGGSVILPVGSSGLSQRQSLLISSENREERLSQKFQREAQEGVAQVECDQVSLQMIDREDATQEGSVGMAEIEEFLNFDAL